MVQLLNRRIFKLERYKEHSIDAIVADLPKGQKSKTISEAIERAIN